MDTYVRWEFLAEEVQAAAVRSTRRKRLLRFGRSQGAWHVWAAGKMAGKSWDCSL